MPGVDRQQGLAELRSSGRRGSGCIATSISGPVDRQRRAQLVRGVGDEPPLPVERAVEPLEHRVERVGELLDLVVGAGQRDPLVQPAVGVRPSAMRRAVSVIRCSGCSSPAGDQPAQRDRDHADHAERDRALGQQRVSACPTAAFADRAIRPVARETSTPGRRRQPAGDASGVGEPATERPLEPSRLATSR